MHRFAKTGFICTVLLLAAICLAACNPYTYAEEGTLLVSAEELADYIGAENVAIVDMQSAEDYAAGHVEGAVNIALADLMINVPVENMLTSPSRLSELMSANGIGDDTLVIAYDSDKNSASRFLWSMMVYGNNNVRVVDGGIAAIQAAGYTLTTETPTPEPAVFTAAEDKDPTWYVTISEMQQYVNEPSDEVVLLDVRSEEEYLTEGKIPGAIVMTHLDNFYSDGTFKDTTTTKINYLEAGMDPEKEIIIYCRTSVRAAPVFVSLYNAGYRNIRIFDGAWLEWTSNSSNPIEYADNSAPQTTVKDAS